MPYMTMHDNIRNLILENGPISFENFMDLALYHPEKGYYNLPFNPIGSQGDYYTMPHMTPVFGAMMARQLAELWEKLSRPEIFTVVELGAGNGHLCRSVLQYAKCVDGFAKAIQYVIVEQSSQMCLRAKEIVPSSVLFYQSASHLPEFTGCVLSNEVFDNIPFSVVVRKNELMELYVGYDQDFIEVYRPASEKVKAFVHEMAPGLPNDFKMEVSLKSLELLHLIAAKLLKGFMITIDYGYTSHELLHESKRKGTMTCYHRHKVHDNPFIHVADQDITCHVNFSALTRYGELNGLEFAGYVCQPNFLRPLGVLPFLSNHHNSLNGAEHNNIRFVSDLLLGSTGNLFKVLIQYKNVQPPLLTGLAFRQPIKI
jgi:SAM-dependent MidA family methyltransferase